MKTIHMAKRGLLNSSLLCTLKPLKEKNGILVYSGQHFSVKISFCNSQNAPFRKKHIACELQTFLLRSSPLSDTSRGGTSATQRQKFHTDEVNQCLLNKSGSHGVPNANLFNFTFSWSILEKCLSANELQQNSNASSREDYILQILTVLLETHRVYI